MRVDVAAALLDIGDRGEHGRREHGEEALVDLDRAEIRQRAAGACDRWVGGGAAPALEVLLENPVAVRFRPALVEWESLAGLLAVLMLVVEAAGEDAVLVARLALEVDGCVYALLPARAVVGDAGRDRGMVRTVDD